MKLRYLILLLTFIYVTGIGSQADGQTQTELYDRYNLGLKFQPSFGIIMPNSDFALGTEKKITLMHNLEPWQFSLSEAKGFTWRMSAFAFSPGDQNRKLAIGCPDGSIRIAPLTDLLPKFLNSDFSLILRGHALNPVTAVAFSRDERTLAAGTKDGTIVVWDTPTEEQLFSLPGHQNTVNTVVFSPDGKYLGSGDAAGNVKLWQLANQKELVLSKGKHSGEVYTVAFSPDPQSQRLASGGDDGIIKLWNISDPHKPPSLLRGHVGPVKTIAFSRDKTHLASGAKDGKILLWNISNESPIEPINHYEKIKNVDNVTSAHSTDIVSVTFSDNGQELCSVSKGGKLVHWHLSKIGIQPNALVYVKKPTPLIKQLAERDQTGPEIIVSTPSTENPSVASTVANFSVEGKVTDRSGIKRLEVQNNPVPVAENGNFSAPVTLSEGNNTISIVAIDNNANLSEKIITIYRPARQPAPDIVQRPQPSEPTVTSPSPVDPEETPQPTDTSESTSNEGVKIVIDNPNIKSKGEQGKPDRAYATVDATCVISGKVNELESGIITVEVENEIGKSDSFTEMENDGSFVFSKPIKLSVGDNKIILTARYGETNVSKTFIIERKISDSQPLEGPQSQPVVPKKETFRITSIRIQNVKLEGSPPGNIKTSEEKPDEITISFDRDSFREVEVTTEVTTTNFAGKIRIFGKTEGAGDKIEYSLNSSTRQEMKYDKSLKVFQLVEKQKTIRLDYQKNTLTFYPMFQEGSTAVVNVTINRKHEREGKDRAIFFAVDDYSGPGSGWDLLKAPIADAEALKKTLEEEYGFEAEILKNPTKKDITKKLSELHQDYRNRQDPELQLLIFFAGHGYKDSSKMGFFVPKPKKGVGLPKPAKGKQDFADKESEFTNECISHSLLRDSINGINCNNILVVMDTCFSSTFSGKISGTRGIKLNADEDEKVKSKLHKRTRQYLTSGSGPVLDMIEATGHSPFAKHLIDTLEKNRERSPYLTFDLLKFEFKKDPFTNAAKNMDVTLDESAIPMAGTFGKSESGGDFIFWRREQ